MRGLIAGLRNKQTTIGAALVALSIILRGVGYYFDGDPSTVTDWESVMNAASWLGELLGIAWLGVRARDASEND